MHVICIAFFYPWRDHRILVLHNRKTIILKCITVNILTAKNTTICGVMISHVLPLPFWHLITVPTSVDKWHCSCIFWKYFFLYHTECSFYCQPMYKYFQKYNFSWCNDFPCTYLQWCRNPTFWYLQKLPMLHFVSCNAFAITQNPIIP